MTQGIKYSDDTRNKVSWSTAIIQSGAYELSKAANEHETQFHEKLNNVMTFDRRLSCAYVIYEVSGKFKFI